jgi:hypothetical protein
MKKLNELYQPPLNEVHDTYGGAVAHFKYSLERHHGIKPEEYMAHPSPPGSKPRRVGPPESKKDPIYIANNPPTFAKKVIRGVDLEAYWKDMVLKDYRPVAPEVTDPKPVKVTDYVRGGERVEKYERARPKKRPQATLPKLSHIPAIPAKWKKSTKFK